jgi:uncharacterized protein (TIGR02391 family)
VGTIKAKRLIIERIIHLQNEVRYAIETEETTLTQSFTLEYGRIVEDAAVAWSSERHFIKHEEQDAETFLDSKSRSGALGILKWIDNHLSTLKMILMNLTPLNMFENVELHSRVAEVSGKLLRDGHYPQAIFEAFKALEEYVREKSGIKDKIGVDLMSHVFSENRSILNIKCSRPETEKEEQQGFKFLFMGSMLGIRNPKGHYIIAQGDRSRTLQYLVLASLLFKTVDDSVVSDCRE